MASLSIEDARAIGAKTNAPVVIVLVIDDTDADAVSWGETARDCRRAEKLVKKLLHDARIDDGRVLSAEKPDDQGSVADSP